MTLDDEELLEPICNHSNHKPSGYCDIPFQMKSLFCRNGKHHSCLWRQCECDCHNSQAEELRRLRMELER
mgnify:CR=1 FL=1